MKELEKLKPTKRLHVMDLVSQAGIDVSDWKNTKGGERKAKSNPKYCYNWAFAGEKCVVLNLWFDQLRQEGSEITMSSNLRETIESYATKSNWKNRAKEFEATLETAYRRQLPVRIIINDGARMLGNTKTTKASEVKFRMLDSLAWRVEKYSKASGKFKLVRGKAPLILIDQFDIRSEVAGPGGKQEITSSVYIRKVEVRRAALERAAGRCELCGQEGFVTKDGASYLETHHIVPLSENGTDELRNVAAICASHHREAHYGKDAAQIRKKLLQFIKDKSNK